MAKKIFPAGVIREYYLDTEIHNSADDEEYYLCFGSDWEMFVLVFYSPNKPYSQGGWSERIFPGNFNTHSVDGVPLKELVDKKLIEIFPTGSGRAF